MNRGIIDLTTADLALVYGLVLLTVGLARWRGIGQEREMLWASLRMVVQLFAVGYVLHLIFALQSAAPVLLILLMMGVFAVQAVAGRVKQKMPRFYRVVALAIFVGCGGATFFFCNLVIGLSPWYDPRYLIPLAGMIIGNSMTGATLAAERLAAEMKERREEIETSLCLGATSTQAARSAVRSAFRAALIPSVNSMAAMGIVFLPGMMTGQILSGTEPIIAVKYQIAIMCVITGSVAATSLLILVQGYRGYFTSNHQLRDLSDFNPRAGG
ncbi:iron export ABC transporter permease subunit FetB [Desulfuromonas versatilis]|uniref:Iron export ABC transporter permease subunit FetB n=1 Tax=Desulfuromonas versatilis TaxID=2802975 RepID=A0ABN6DZV3_9BACT|nr:iron export ABC transporter permease subunit FetB [Desulfuromonas versatilis]BCR05541.1 iron export ABC transporter permease subunit FetB [Desulfuromonas versatilis]